MCFLVLPFVVLLIDRQADDPQATPSLTRAQLGVPRVVTQLVAEDEDPVGGAEAGSAVALVGGGVEQDVLGDGARALRQEGVAASVRQRHLVARAVVHGLVRACGRFIFSWLLVF